MLAIPRSASQITQLSIWTFPQLYNPSNREWAITQLVKVAEEDCHKLTMPMMAVSANPPFST